MNNRKDSNFYYNFLINFIGEDWFREQVKLVEEKLKEEKVGYYGHPLIKDYYDTKVKMRAASLKKQSYCVLGTGYSNMVYLGKNLYTLKSKDIDLSKFLSKLHSKENFEDVCWELETMTTLINNGSHPSFIEETKHKTPDILINIFDVELYIECKNKHINDKEYNNNSSFCDDISKKLFQILEKNNLIDTDIVLTIDGTVNDNDIKKITQEFKKMIDGKINYKKIKDIYRLKRLGNEYRSIHTGIVANKNKHERIIRCPQLNNRLLCKFPPIPKKLKNLSVLLKKANKQFNKESCSCVFLQVPFNFFEQAKKEIEELLKNDFSNISAVKIVSKASYFPPKNGFTKLYKEDLIINNNAKHSLPLKIENLLSDSLFHKNYEKDNLIFFNEK